MIFRDAQLADCDAIARLHASSWRSAYQGILIKDFLDKFSEADRLTVWRARFAANAENRLVRLAIEDDQLAGFACVVLDEHERWGAMLDNLHIAPTMKGRGIGRELMGQAARWVIDRRPHSGLHLWVYEENHAARHFYEHVGGVAVERTLRHAPDGSHVPALRYAWRDLMGLARGGRGVRLREGS